MGDVTTLPRGRPYTGADLETMPDDGRRHELIDGALVVTPAPFTRHQTVVLNLAVTLKRACPADLQVFVAPFDVALAGDTVVQPDVLVARRAELTARDLPTAPVLAVEVLSPSTQRLDTTLKKSRYEEAGCSSYWTIDPDLPALTVWELEERRYVQRVRVVGADSHAVRAPFPVTLSPQALLD